MEDTSYDEACRYLARQAEGPLVYWLLRLNPARLRFDGWLDSVLMIPGTRQRVCDAVARLADLDRNGLPVAGLVEFQAEPDPTMFGRMLLAGALCWLTVKPTEHPGDRYELCAVVVNLTGQGSCARDMSLGATAWKLTPCEVNLSTLDAGAVLEEIAKGDAPPEVLAWIPLMQRGDDPGIIQRWLEIAQEEPDAGRRGIFAFAVLFADLVGRQDLWRKPVEGLKMRESPVVQEWKAEARREGLQEGKREGKLEGRREGMRDTLLRILQKRFGAIPVDLTTAIRAGTDITQLEAWTDAALTAASLDDFRRGARL